MIWLTINYGICLWSIICIVAQARRLKVNVCHGKGDAFAGAFLCSSHQLLESEQRDSVFVEGASGWNLMMPGYKAVKSMSYLDFFVEHLSGLEHHIRMHREDHLSPLHPHAKEVVYKRYIPLLLPHTNVDVSM